MTKFFKHLQLELTFIFKNWLFIIAPFLYLIFVYIWLANKGFQPGDPPSLYERTYEFLSVGHTLTLGIIFLASVLAIRRDKQTVLLDWTNSLPTSHLSFILSKYIAINLYSLLFTLFFFLSFLAVGYLDDLSISFLLEHGLDISIQSQLSYFVSIALGMILAILIPNRIVYIIIFCAWMFGTFFMEGFIITKYNVYYLKTFHLNQFFLYSSHTLGWSDALQEKEVWYSRLFVFFFSLLLLLLTVVTSTTKRLSSHRNKAGLSLAVISILTVASVIPYGSLWLERVTHFENTIKPSAKEFIGETIDFLEVDSYEIEINREGNSTISVEATVTMPPVEKDEIIFTLYPTLNIESITWNGQPVQFQRDHHLITFLNIENEGSNECKITYTGALNEWGYKYNKEINFAFLNKEDMYLPSYLAWYPLMGEVPLYERMVNEFEDTILANTNSRITALEKNLPRADYTVTLKGFDQQVYGTNDRSELLENGTQRFTSTQATGMTLFSHKNVEETKTGIPFQIITTKERADTVLAHFTDMEGLDDYYHNWIPDSLKFNRKFIYLPSLEYIGFKTYIFTELDDAIFLDENAKQIIYTDDGYLDNTFTGVKSELIVKYLFGRDYNETFYYHHEDSVLHAIAQAFLLVTYIEYFGYEWDDFQLFNGTMFWNLFLLSDLNNSVRNPNYTTTEKLDYLLEKEYTPSEEKVIYMVAKEIEQGRIEEVKDLLSVFYEDIQSNDKAGYTYQEWLTIWNKTIEKEVALQ